VHGGVGTGQGWAPRSWPGNPESTGSRSLPGERDGGIPRPRLSALRGKEIGLWNEDFIEFLRGSWH
jgi:hypothetical protein